MAIWNIPIVQVALILVITLVVAKIIGSLVKAALSYLADRKKIDREELSLARKEWVFLVIVFIIGLKACIPLLSIGSIAPMVQTILSSTLILLSGTIVLSALHVVIELYIHPIVAKSETKLDDQIIAWISGASGIVIYTLAVLYILSLWGVEIGPLVASLGIAGLAVALALQPTLGNIFSGIALVVDKTFEPGDIIKLESGEVGKVTTVKLRTTRIQNFDNEMITIPNSVLANARVVNYCQPNRSARVNVDFGVEYGTDPEYVKEIVIEECNKIPEIDKEKDPQVWFMSMGDNALTFTARFWVADISDKWVTKQDAMTRIYRRLYKEGIGIPFPQRTVWMLDGGKAPKPTPYAAKFNKTNKKLLPRFGYPREQEEKKSTATTKETPSSSSSKKKRAKK